MDAKQVQVFDAALAGCEELKTHFPNDRQLSTVIEQLQSWRRGRGGAGGADAISERYKRNIDRHIRPLSEAVASLVHQAEQQAVHPARP
jgi:hypothetical protein